MANVLIAYASTHGQTAKIGRRIADVLQADEVEVELCDLGAGEDLDPSGHHGVIVAASIHRGTHQREVVSWVKRRQSSLAGTPSAFVSVSLTAAEDTDEARTVTQGMIDDFTSETGWTPDRTVGVAGALQYLEYDFFTRTLMRLIMRHGGHPTDASQDYDYTDWDAVEDFAHKFADTVRQA